MVYLFIALVAVGISAFITYLCLRPQLKRVHYINLDTKEENTLLEATNNQLRSDNRVLEQERLMLREQNTEALQQLNTLNRNIAELEQQSIEAGNRFYEQNMELARKQLQEDLAAEKAKTDEAINAYLKEFFRVMEDSVSEFKFETAEQTRHCDELREQEAQLQSTVEAAVAAAKRAEEIKTQADFYKLQLSEIDIEEIRMLRNIAPYLRDQEPLNKVIWKMYYEKPTTDLIGRVIGSGIHTGIYKITNLDNDKCYVGQAVNLAERWKQHIKRGVGADTPTRNKLYPAMMAIGVERFSFEVVEECGREQLDAREDYWQDYFKAKEFGYSIK